MISGVIEVHHQLANVLCLWVPVVGAFSTVEVTSRNGELVAVSQGGGAAGAGVSFMPEGTATFAGGAALLLGGIARRDDAELPGGIESLTRSDWTFGAYAFAGLKLDLGGFSLGLDATMLYLAGGGAAILQAFDGRIVLGSTL